MLEFIQGCASLFNDTFQAASGEEYFRFLGAFLLVEVFIAFFRFLLRDSRRL